MSSSREPFSSPARDFLYVTTLMVFLSTRVTLLPVPAASCIMRKNVLGEPTAFIIVEEQNDRYLSYTSLSGSPSTGGSRSTNSVTDTDDPVDWTGRGRPMHTGAITRTFLPPAIIVATSRPFSFRHFSNTSQGTGTSSSEHHAA